MTVCAHCSLPHTHPCQTTEDTAKCPIYQARVKQALAAQAAAESQAATAETTPPAGSASATSTEPALSSAAAGSTSSPSDKLKALVQGTAAPAESPAVAQVMTAASSSTSPAAVAPATVEAAGPSAAPTSPNAMPVATPSTLSPPPSPAHPQQIADADTAHDPTNPSYYARFAIQPIVFIRANNLAYWQGNAVKYVCRADAKNGVEDIEKAIDYLMKERAYLLGDPNWHLATVKLPSGVEGVAQ